MARVIDTKIPDIKTSWENYSGARVEEFIKEKIGNIDVSKFGYLTIEQGTGGLQTMRFFASEEAYQQWFGDKATYADNLLKEFSFYSNAPEPSWNTKAQISKYPATNISKGSSNTFALAYNCFYGDDPSDKDTANGLMTVKINGVKVSSLQKTLVASGTAVSNVYNVDLTDFLTSETNIVVIEVTNTHGFIKSFRFEIKTYNLQLTFDNNYDESKVQNGKWDLRVNCNGAEAIVYCQVENDGKKDVYTKTINNSSGEFTIDPNQKYVLGAHEITLWAENKELGIKTSELKTTYIKGSDAGNAVSALCFGKGIVNSAKQFSIVEIPYYFYLPNDETGSKIKVETKILFDNNAKSVKLSDQVVTLSSTHESGLKKIIVALDNGNYLPFITVQIKVGDLTIERKIGVTSIGVTIKDTDECKVFYSMKGKTNNDANAINLTSSYNGAITSRLIRSKNFQLDENNGFLDGYGIFVRPGKTLTLNDFQPFANDIGANGTKQGRTIELEFQSGVTSDENAVIIDCWNNGTGFRIFANRIQFGCTTDSVMTYFPEQSRVKVSFVIDGTTTHTRNDIGGGSIQEADVNLAYLFVNGVIVRLFDYSTANWKQGDVQNIVIGSDSAAVELYSLRIYDKALNYSQILNNFAYDTPDVEDVYDSSGNFVRYGKVSIARRNDILNSSGDIHQPSEIVSYAKVQQALPNTPIIVWNVDDLPYNKNNPDVPINGTEFKNPLWTKEAYGKACAPFTVGAHMFNADGTSSNGYPLPYKNWAEIFKDASGKSVNITLDPGNTNEVVTAYSITKGVDKGETDMVHKVNFASSEGIFNIHAMHLFQDILLKCAKTNNELYTKFQLQQLGGDITYRKSLSGFPEIGFRRTSASGAESPKFLSIYNFINNKYSASFLGFPAKDYKHAQIWEVDENVNFFNRLITDNRIDGSGNVIKSTATANSPIYYARVPKKSPTNTKNKLGVLSKATDNVKASNDELACIKRFHNWVVSCNYHLAERYKKQHGYYETLSPSVTYNGTTYNKDSVEYRKAKFVNEYQNYIHKDDAIFYFIFCVFIVGMDSMDKNMSIAFDDITTEADGSVSAALARIFLRDTDSRDLFNNSGVLTFKYWAEWNDSFNNSTLKTEQISGEEYDSELDTWKPKLSSGFSPVFNGRLSGLIDLIWSCWDDDIKSMYKTMRDSGLNATYMFNLYLSYWKQWCENLYNVDSMGYVNTGNFTKAYGDKLQLSKYFYEKRSRYLDSKYCCGASVVNNLRLRLYDQGKGLAIKHYSPMYASVQWGANNFATVRNIDGGYGLIPFGFKNPQNATFDIDDADMITDIKTYTRSVSGEVKYYGLEGLGNFYFDQNMALCTRLEEFILDYPESSPNTQIDGISNEFDLSKMTLLKKVVVRNVKNLKKLVEINSEIVSEINFKNTSIRGVKLLPNQYLRKLVLPESIEELYLTGLTNLQNSDLEIAGTNNVNKFVYYDCPNIAFDAMLVRLAANGKLKFIEAKNIDITIKDKSIWDILVNSNSDLQGKITLLGFTLSFEDKVKAVKKWGNIDDNSNKLYIVYDKVACTSVEISGDAYIQEVVDANYSIYPTPIIANDISNVSWSISENEYATINPNNGHLYVNKISSIKEDKNAKAVIKVNVTKHDGSTLQSDFVVYFSKRDVKLWDIVYADGSTSDKVNKNKTIIGFVYYQDENGSRVMNVEQWTPVYFSVADMTVLPSISEVFNLDTPDFINAPSDNKTIRRGTKVPLGLYNTYLYVQMRDISLAKKNIVITENMYDKIDTIPNNNIYNPYLTKTYDYEPKVKVGEQLNPKFARHNWYFPIWGEINELSYQWYLYAFPAKDSEKPDAAFVNLIKNVTIPFAKMFAGIILGTIKDTNGVYIFGYKTGDKPDRKNFSIYNAGLNVYNPITLICCIL